MLKPRSRIVRIQKKMSQYIRITTENDAEPEPDYGKTYKNYQNVEAKEQDHQNAKKNAPV